MTYALRVESVSKYFGEFAAVEDVSFEVPKGCIYGLLGPNGAGKTTTLRMVNGILAPDRGQIFILGDHRPGAASARLIGYLPEERGLYPRMTVTELLVFFAELRGVSRAVARERAGKWLNRLGIEDWAKKKLQDLSKGMQQKVQFATALLHEPQILFLDEPWSGLDPINAEVLREVVLEQRAAGRTVVFSTHRLEQAEQICDHVCIIARGKKALEGSLKDIKKSAARVGMVTMSFANAEQCGQAKTAIAQHAAVRSLAQKDTALEIQLAESGDARAVLSALFGAGLAVDKFERLEPSLHQIFVERVGKEASASMQGREVSL
jgi:ABC-2 type transport system ATP-binding protein